MGATGLLERKLDRDLVARVLALGLTPHKRGKQPPTYPPIVRPASDKWPTPAYREKLRRKRRGLTL